MNNAAKFIFAFALGAAAGSLVANKVLKSKYERITQEEIDAYKAYVKGRNSKAEETAETPKEESTDDSDEEADAFMGLTNQYRSESDREEDGEKLKRSMNIHVISPEEYDDIPDYQKKSLTYYADGVIADEFDNIIENPDDIVGENIDDHFGEYEEDSVFVRNDELKCDFEILRDIQTYSEAMGLTDLPHDAEG